MGDLMRQYWIPVLQSADLPEKDGAPMRVRLLGENLVAFRDTEGRIGLLDHVCPHRCASLFYGRNEENGLRCLYHGWKFDAAGRCVDIPNEPPGSGFGGQIRATAYPCVEKNGIVWTYLGPDRDRPPPLPELGWALVAPDRRGALRYQRACNWLQALEGDFDSSHLSFLHLAFDPNLQGTASDKKAGIEYYRNLARMDKRPVLEVRDTEGGVMYGARRDADAGKVYWRVTQFLLPFYTSVPGYGGKSTVEVYRRGPLGRRVVRAPAPASPAPGPISAAIYTGNKAAGKFMKERVFDPGNTMPWNELTRFATGADLSPKALAEDLGIAK